MRKKSKIFWKSPPPEIEPERGRLRRYHVEQILTDKAKQIISSGVLQQGAAFTALVDLNDEEPRKDEIAPPHPYTVFSWSRSTMPAVSRGDVLIYVKQVRVEEQGKAGIMRVLRHVFLAGGGLRMIDINYIDVL